LGGVPPVTVLIPSAESSSLQLDGNPPGRSAVVDKSKRERNAGSVSEGVRFGFAEIPGSNPGSKAVFEKIRRSA
jgi:hypothetical protein